MNINHINDIKDRLDGESRKKINALINRLKELGSLVIAYSGGADSTFLLKIAFDILKDNVLAVIGKSDTYLDSEIRDAIDAANLIGVKIETTETCELDNDKFASNPTNRCYYCKNELFSKLNAIAGKHNIKYTADGSNFDDLKDYRPGMQAASDLKVLSPLIDAEITKNDIVKISKLLGLPTWNKPPQPCLSSRFPYGTEITRERLKKVAQAENYISKFGIKQFRVRYHNETARIELLREDMPILIDETNSKKIYEKFRTIGFAYVTIDILGYRMGSMNENLRTE